MKKYFGLTLLFWSLFIALNAICDSIIFHQGQSWYMNLWLWHFLKYFWMLALFLTGWFAKKLYLVVRSKLIYMGGMGSLDVKTKKVRLRLILTIAFFLFYGLLWRWIWFEHLIDTFAGRI